MNNLLCDHCRTGFTMIELIFVIIVIGILAVISIPKLAATRDDAKMAAIAQETMTGATDIASYTVTHGHSLSDLSAMSPAINHLVHTYGAQVVSGQPIVYIPWKGDAHCLALKILNQGGNTETLVIEANGTSEVRGCNRLRSLIDTSRFPIPLHGSMIRY